MQILENPASPTAKDIDREAERLLRRLMYVECHQDEKWNFDNCRHIAPLTLEIAALKKARHAVLLAHSYVVPEIIYGVADHVGDSYQLSFQASQSDAEVIVFAGVVFMAETAKILSPEATVVVPDINSGCSLADSLDASEVIRLKAIHPDAAVVCYINSTAAVKAECDVCVTSSNVYDIVARLPQERIVFVPDRLMAENIREEMRNRGIKKEIISSDGTCIVHDDFDPAKIDESRKVFPGLAVVSHPECTPEVAAISDFVGSTSAMLKYVKETQAPYYLMLTECGLVGRLQVEDPEKHFVSGCRLCPYMKLNSLEKVRDALRSPRPDQVITLDEEVRLKARRSIDRMFELTA